MIIDLNKINFDPFKETTFDVCICGAGVAGITLALKLSPKLNIALFEGGGMSTHLILRLSMKEKALAKNTTT